jgi:hypothetical protein
MLQAVINGNWDLIGKKHVVARSVDFSKIPGRNGQSASEVDSGNFNGLGYTTQNALSITSTLNRSKTGVKGNPKKVYILGQSMGGGGTIATLKKYASTFAAALPICAAGKFKADDFTANSLILNVAIKMVHDRYDSTVDFQYLLDSMKVLNAQSGWKVTPSTVIYSTDEVMDYYYDSAHLSWVRTYRNPEIRDWLFAQSQP